MPEDAGPVAAVLRRSIEELCHADHHGQPEILAAWLENKTPRSVEAWISSADNFCATAVSAAGEVIGFAMLRRDGEIVLLYVSPDSTGQRVGHELLQALERRALELGLTELSLDSTKTALPFYRHHGFRGGKACSERADGLSCLAMRKRLVA